MWLRALLLIVFGLSGGVSEGRVKRHLVFEQGSRIFFNVDLRDNLFENYKLFAHVIGVKMDWDLPSGLTKTRFKRSDLFEGIEHLLHRQNVNGTHCIRKFICEASEILPKSNHFLAQLFEIIFSNKNIPETDTNYIDKDCSILNQDSAHQCPLSLLSLLSAQQTNFNVFFK